MSEFLCRTQSAPKTTSLKPKNAVPASLSKCFSTDCRTSDSISHMIYSHHWELVCSSSTFNILVIRMNDIYDVSYIFVWFKKIYKKVFWYSVLLRTKCRPKYLLQQEFRPVQIALFFSFFFIHNFYFNEIHIKY